VIKQGAETQRQAIRAAAHWYARLTAAPADAEVTSAWQHWLAAAPHHQLAWQHVEAVSRQMARLPGELASSTFSGAGQSRRHVLGMLLLTASAGGVGMLGWRSDARHRLSADYRTAVGERRSFTLTDGSQLILNTASAVDQQFDKHQRLLVLRSGEIAVHTASDPAGRPFLVDTTDGRVRALGTRFTLHCDSRGSEVAVQEKAVELSVPGIATPVRVEAGQRARFDPAGIQSPQRSDASVGAWQQGSLIAVNQPLGDLLRELGRYRSGWLNCDPQVASLKVSGAFPIDDTDRALQSLVNSFPLRVLRRTAYWVTVGPR
jgi:transmembrane sensor